jgi:hypothetical protein
MWDELPKPTDKRNLSEKIKNVCEHYNEKELGRKARMACEAKLELGRIDYKDRGAYLYRVFTASETRLMSLLKDHGSDEISDNDIDNWIEELVLNSKHTLDERSKDYTYAFKNRETLRNAILELFDSCYLAFDKGE